MAHFDRASERRALLTYSIIFFLLVIPCSCVLLNIVNCPTALVTGVDRKSADYITLMPEWEYD